MGKEPADHSGLTLRLRNVSDPCDVLADVVILRDSSSSAITGWAELFRSAFFFSRNCQKTIAFPSKKCYNTPVIR